MSLLTALLNTYEYCEDHNLVDRHDGTDTVLLPLYHNTIKSDGKNILNLVFNRKGNLIRADFLPKDDIVIFPITVDSVARSGKNPPPHPLMDKMSYIIPGDNIGHENYMKGLKDFRNFVEDPDVKEFLDIFLNFIQKEGFLKEILEETFRDVEYDFDGEKVSFQDGKKTVTYDIPSIFLTYEVSRFDGAKNVNITNYKDLHDWYIRYVRSLDEELEVCNISGKLQPRAEKHRGVFGNAKLISVSNNKETYYGRFKSGDDIITIGTETSEKIHLMLRYLLQNKNSNRWLGSTQYLVNWFSDDIGNDADLDLTINTQTSEETSEKEKNERPVTILNRDVGTSFFRGRMEFDENSRYYLALLDKSSNGRTSLKSFRELPVSQLVERLRNWENKYYWYWTDHESHMKYRQTPSLYRILVNAYGIERDGRLVLDKDEFIKDQMNKLITSLIDGGEIPKNITKKFMLNIRNRSNYDKTWNNMVSTAMAVLRTGRKGEYDDMLDRENTDRSYLYGRLLYIYEAIESATYGNDDKRITNAEKFWTAYTTNPAKTMMTLEQKTQIYLQKLRSQEMSDDGTKFRVSPYLIREKDEIIEKLSTHYKEGSEINKPLDYNFIFGYYGEKQARYTKRTEKEERKEENDQ